MVGKRTLIAAVAAVLAVLAIVVVVVVADGRRHAPVTPSSLGSSVARMAGRSPVRPCTGARIDDHLTPGFWDCDVWEEYGSYGITYRVRIDDGDGASCWTATQGGPNVEPGVRSELPARISGCVQRRD